MKRTEHVDKRTTWAGQWWRHALLVPMTFITLYPVLWVIKMAVTPGDAFELSANPIPTTI